MHAAAQRTWCLQFTSVRGHYCCQYRGARLCRIQWGLTSLSSMWNLKNGSQMEVKGHRKACVGYGTCGLNVNIPSACPHLSMEMYANTGMHVFTHTFSDFMVLSHKQRQNSSSGEMELLLQFKPLSIVPVCQGSKWGNIMNEWEDCQLIHWTIWILL